MNDSDDFDSLILELSDGTMPDVGTQNEMTVTATDLHNVFVYKNMQEAPNIINGFKIPSENVRKNAGVGYSEEDQVTNLTATSFTAVAATSQMYLDPYYPNINVDYSPNYDNDYYKKLVEISTILGKNYLSAPELNRRNNMVELLGFLAAQKLRTPNDLNFSNYFANPQKGSNDLKRRNKYMVHLDDDDNDAVDDYDDAVDEDEEARSAKKLKSSSSKIKGAAPEQLTFYVIVSYDLQIERVWADVLWTLREEYFPHSLKKMFDHYVNWRIEDRQNCHGFIYFTVNKQIIHLEHGQCITCRAAFIKKPKKEILSVEDLIRYLYNSQPIDQFFVNNIHYQMDTTTTTTTITTVPKTAYSTETNPMQHFILPQLVNRNNENNANYTNVTTVMSNTWEYNQDISNCNTISSNSGEYSDSHTLQKSDCTVYSAFDHMNADELGDLTVSNYNYRTFLPSIPYAQQLNKVHRPTKKRKIDHPLYPYEDDANPQNGQGYISKKDATEMMNEQRATLFLLAGVMLNDSRQSRSTRMLEFLKSEPNWNEDQLKRAGSFALTELKTKCPEAHIATLFEHLFPLEKEHILDEYYMVQQIGQYVENYTYYSFICYYLSDIFGEQLVVKSNLVEKCLTFIGKGQWWMNYITNFRTTSKIDKLVNAPLRTDANLSIEEQIIEIAKMAARCTHMLTQELEIGPDKRKMLKNYRMTCAMTGKPLGDCNDPISILIMYFEDREPFVCLYRRVKKAPNEYMFVRAVRNLLKNSD